MKRAFLSLALVLIIFTGVASMASGSALQDEEDYEATIEAQQTTIAALEGTVQARGDKINAQRTQIAELRAQLPVVNDDPAIGDVFAIRDFEFTIQGTHVQETVGEFDPREANGIYLVVYLDVKNVSDRPTVFPYDDFELVDGRGRSYSFDEFAAIDLLIYEFDQFSTMYEELQPGVITSTGLIFDVPDDATGFTLTNIRGDFEAQLDR
jgi:hypothetical protein